MMHAAWCRYSLDFKFTARTSRETMNRKDTYYIKVWDDVDGDTRFGIGECGLFRGLSCDDVPDYETMLDAVCVAVATSSPQPDLTHYPSILMGVETAISDWRNGCDHNPFPSDWLSGHEGIMINGLVWMGDYREMLDRISAKLDDGFKCIKLKIGGIRFDDELKLLGYIRRQFDSSVLELRLDANGAFAPGDVMERLERLAEYDIHSIEQPIAPKQWAQMAEVCHRSPIPVALDEELIGIFGQANKRGLLEQIMPSYIILKPTLCGGFSGADEWIALARELGIGWWATSALESNVGLNAIAQWVAGHTHNIPQGLGTGALYYNNIPSPLELRGDRLFYNPDKQWIIPDNLDWKVF